MGKHVYKKAVPQNRTNQAVLPFDLGVKVGAIEGVRLPLTVTKGNDELCYIADVAAEIPPKK